MTQLQRTWIFGAVLAGWSVTAAAQFTVEADPEAEFSPSVAYAYDPLNPGAGPDLYGAAFTDATGSGCAECTQNVTAVLLNGGGARLGEMQVSITPNTDDKEPAVAYDPINRRFLVAYYVKDSNTPYCGHRVRGNVYVKVINTSGGLVAGPINISNSINTHNVRVRAAFDRFNQRYLVVWERASTDNICANIVAQGNNLGAGLARSDWEVVGRVLSNTGSPITSLFYPSVYNSLYVQQNPDVAAYGKCNTFQCGGFLVGWGDKRLITTSSGSRTESVFGQLISSGGARRFTYDLILGDTAYQDRFPRIAYNTNRDQWVVTWYGAFGSYFDDFPGSPYAQRMQRDGAWLGCPGGCPVQVAGGTLSDAGHPDIVYCQSSQKYWIAWQRTGNRVQYKPYNNDMAGLSASVALAGGNKAPAFADYCRADGRTIMLYESYSTDPDGDIRGVFLY